MRIQTILILVVGLALSSPAISYSAEQAQDFFSGVEDLPLAPGLGEVREEGMIYDTPAGRIVHAYAQGPSRLGDVISFYRATLPQLGWQIVGATRFQRETEMLELKVTKMTNGVRLAVSLTPLER